MTIQQLSNDLGVGVDTLRIWERRYGCPVPERDSRGHRSYSSKQAEELRVVVKLRNFGMRPAQIFALDALARQELLLQKLDQALPMDSELQRLTAQLPAQQMRRTLQLHLEELGLERFIQEFAVALLQTLDRGWTEGWLTIAREHLVSDRLEELLKARLAVSPQSEDPTRILFLTLSGERHKLGLLMAAALFQAQGFDCLLVNEELPLAEVPALAAELEVEAVALSFSAHYAARQAKQDLAGLRRILDPKIKLLAGGIGIRGRMRMRNLVICTELEKIPNLCRQYFRPVPGK
ncbi:DNA-binding transcriptional regulator, MerR family [Geoalkalibacter ferrihydriticus]|uniref:MerR family transcriptional regulator n=2 Tax=Geoalkalibacter ferrihydriticus TaxID=392333 RepID=A0A0C2DSW4_9BACT|nr:MerR family transcriptional regulator [Geoalkalibacter ferrihydriticus]KIH76549.1 hypothetical protein GFER_10260 [Geoalkalibacter ferrihydriticus DSM 17813]SDM00843.1 DNA-binding transcriptional regulator, MerR family [Geoalkalibacter ferrihydriticus]